MGISGGTKEDVCVCVCVCKGDEVLCALLIHSLAGPSNMLSQIVCAQQEAAWRDYIQQFTKLRACVGKLKQFISKYSSAYARYVPLRVYLHLLTWEYTHVQSFCSWAMKYKISKQQRVS